MFGVISALSWILASLFKSRKRLGAENLTLRHQLNVLRRSAPRRASVRGWDRCLFVWLYRLWPGVLNSIVIVRPGTVLRWHRAGFKVFWRWRSRHAPGRPRLPKEIRALIPEMSLANPRWGAPRIHGELLKLGIDVAQSTVARYMVRGRRPPAQSWKTFLRDHAEGIASVDLFVVPTAGLKLLFGLLVLRHERRQLVHVAVTSNPTADWVARQITEAFPWDTTPAHLIRDRDAAYGVVFRRRLRSMGIRDRPTAARSPWQTSPCTPRSSQLRSSPMHKGLLAPTGHHPRRLRRQRDDAHRRPSDATARLWDDGLRGSLLAGVAVMIAVNAILVLASYRLIARG